VIVFLEVIAMISLCAVADSLKHFSVLRPDLGHLPEWTFDRKRI